MATISRANARKPGANAQRKSHSDGSTGTGPALINPRDVVINSAESKAYVVDLSLAAVFEIDLATGNRTFITSSSVGQGVTIVLPNSLLLSETEDVLYLGNSGGLIAIHLATGARAVVSN